MYISELKIKGYKNSKETSVIKLNKGLNILIGENGCGKTAIVNALRLILREPEALYQLSSDDFYCSGDKSYIANEIEIDASFSELSDDEKITFLSWLTAELDAELHLTVKENKNKVGYYKRNWWGGKSSASAFEEDTFDRINCIYLPPLRDAESKLSNSRNSKISQLIKKKYGDNGEKLVQKVSDFNKSIIDNADGSYNEITDVKNLINKRILETLGKSLGQSINLQFSETTLNKIVDNIRMVFFPNTNETDIKKFRELTTNSMGYNNLLYIATVFSELELLENNDCFQVLLIEEPEAHLHPQLQVRFIKYLQVLSKELVNSQIIVTSHSPVLASSVDIDSLVHVAGSDTHICTTCLIDKHFKAFSDEGSEEYKEHKREKEFLNRWLDATKSTMLFSKGIIMVEGIAESLIIPKLAELVLKEYNNSVEETNKLPLTLNECGISVININGINFKYFLKLFGNFDSSSGDNVPIYCSAITDRDPDKDCYPKIDETPASNNPVAGLMDEINVNQYIHIFMSPYKTLEYDLFMLNPKIITEALISAWGVATGEVHQKLDDIIQKCNDTYPNNTEEFAFNGKYILKHIEDSKVGKGYFAQLLSEIIDDSFKVPEYIKEAILWVCKNG